MNKLLLVFASLFILLSAGSAFAVKDVAYIIRDPSLGDANIINSFNNLNLTYSIIGDSAIPTTNFSDYRMLFIGQATFNNYQQIPVLSKNSLVMNTYYLSTWKIASSTGQISVGNGYLKGIFVYNNSINVNLTSPLQIYNAYSQPAYYLPLLPNRATGSKGILTTNDYDKNHIVGVLYPGGTLYGGGNATKRLAFDGMLATNYMTSQAKQLFENTILWTLKGEDLDKDGYYTDQDCNDNNASIHPNATEIPYNHIDENCDGFDLADVDGDGYCKLGYNITNKALQCPKETGSIGTDCNDNNANIYLGAFESGNGTDTNCIVEAPVFTGNIDNISWLEDTPSENITNINLSSYFHDPDGYPIMFGVYDSSSDGNISLDISDDGIVNFSSPQYWSGKDWVIFKAVNSMGKFNVTNNVTLNVIHVNHAPLLEDIDDIYVSEGDTARIIANASDIDRDNLTYFYDSPFNSSGEWKTGLGDSGDYSVNVSVSDGSLGDKKIANVFVLDKLYINEFMPSPQNESGWVEIYNPHNYSVSLDNCRLENSNNTLDLEGEISSFGFSTFIWDSLDYREFSLVCDNVLIGNVSYGSPGLLPDVGESLGRIQDGGNDWRIFDFPTKGDSNIKDAEPPQVSLVNPENDSNLTTDEVSFNFIATDDQASELNCSLYSNLYGDMNLLWNGEAGNNSINEINESNVSNGVYEWHVECSDGKNIGISENRMLTVNIPEAPVVEDVNNITAYETDVITLFISASDVNNDNLTYSVNDSRFVQDNYFNNKFVWHTDYGENGSYDFTITVSDGMFNTTKEFSILLLHKNRAPVLTDNISNIEFNEDQNVTLNLSSYFSDPDGDKLQYFLIGPNNITAILINDTAVLIPKPNWNGVEELRIRASDTHFLITSNYFNVTVFPVNDAPVLQDISNITINEGDTAKIIANASDIDTSLASLTYSIDDTMRFNQSGNTFTWQTNYSDSGTYYFNVSVSDGNLSDYKIVKVNVINVNEPPHFKQINDSIIYEDSGANVILGNLSDFAYDDDGSITAVNVVNSNASEVKCEVSSNNLIATPAGDFATEGFNGLQDRAPATCTISAIDNENAATNYTISMHVININDAPVIDAYYPNYNPKIAEDASQMFNISWHDIDTNRNLVNVSWFVDGILNGTGNKYNFAADGNGTFNVSVVLDDGNLTNSTSWIIQTSNIPIADSFNGDDTTDFNGMSDTDLQNANLTLEKTGFGKIEFLEPVDLRDAVDFDRYASIQWGLAGIDTSVFQSLKDEKARITFYNLNFSKIPTIYYNSKFSTNPDEITQICPGSICSNVSYSEGILTFNVASFSTFMVGDTQTCSQQSGFVCSSNEKCTSNFILARDSGQCCATKCIIDFQSAETCNSTTSKIGLTIESPNKGEKFKAGDSIDGSIKINNHFTDSRDFNYEVGLYDVTDNQDVESVDDTLSVDGNSNDNADFSISIPTNIDQTHQFVLHLQASDDNNDSLCNENYIPIDIIKDNYDIIIENVSASMACGEGISGKVTVQNIGAKKLQDVYVQIDSEFGSYQSGTFSLNINKKADESFSLDASNATNGTYDIKATLFFEGDTVSKTISIPVFCDNKNEVVKEATIEAEAVNLSAPEQQLDKIGTLNFALAVGIVVLMILLVIVLISRNSRKRSSIKK